MSKKKTSRVRESPGFQRGNYGGPFLLLRVRGGLGDVTDEQEKARSQPIMHQDHGRNAGEGGKKKDRA